MPASCTRSHTPGSRPSNTMQRVQVAVAGVEDVHRDERVRVGDLVDAPQHLDEAGARDDRVVQVVVGRDAGDRAERRLAALPQQRALGVVGGDADARPRRARARSRGPPRPARRRRRRARRPRRAARLRHPAGTRRRRSPRPPGDPRVHHLERGRQHAARDRAASPSTAAASIESNAHSIVATAGGSGVSRTATRVAMPIVPSDPTKQPRRS